MSRFGCEVWPGAPNARREIKVIDGDAIAHWKTQTEFRAHAVPKELKTKSIATVRHPSLRRFPQELPGPTSRMMQLSALVWRSFTCSVTDSFASVSDSSWEG